ncbi:MAG: hypothetical protein M3Y54_19685, partial [Bacteroidota bacterium]|nr:hypothetical protein [Bacteroidota bacterium]
GYTHPFSAHLLLQFSASKPQTQQFFAAIYPHIRNAEDWGTKKPAQLLNIGLTYPGLQCLDCLPAEALQNFPSEFIAGPASSGSQSSLNDVGTSDPANWWGPQAPGLAQGNIHAVLHAYGLLPADLEALLQKVTLAAQASATTVLWRVDQYQLPDDRIHFDYRDGISNPDLNLSDGSPGTPADLGNFLIGYAANSYSEPGPTGSDPASVFAKNGCYNAFRMLYQDVAQFNELLVREAPHFDATTTTNTDPSLGQEWVAAKLVGRWRNGSPLMLSPYFPEKRTENGEDFGYLSPTNPLDDTTSALRCPFAAHTRVTNPRDELLVNSETPPPPRILRRGQPYGPSLPSNATTDDGVDRGLIGLFLCGSLARQFEKIYGWMNAVDFSQSFDPGAYPTPQDALMGNRDTSADFTVPLPAPAAPFLMKNLPPLIVTRGTAYCLLPSLSSLRQLAGLPATAPKAAPKATKK